MLRVTGCRRAWVLPLRTGEPDCHHFTGTSQRYAQCVSGWHGVDSYLLIAPASSWRSWVVMPGHGRTTVLYRVHHGHGLGGASVSGQEVQLVCVLFGFQALLGPYNFFSNLNEEGSVYRSVPYHGGTV